MKKFLLILGAICLAFPSFATERILYQQDFETVDDVASTGWTYDGDSMIIASDGNGKHLELQLGAKNGRSGQVTWGQNIFFDEEGESLLVDGCYTVSYDFCIVRGSNNQYNGCFTVFTNHAPVRNQNYRNPWSPQKSWENYLVDISQVSYESYSFVVNGDLLSLDSDDGSKYYYIDETNPLTFMQGEWYSVNLDVNVNTRTVEYSIVSRSGDVVKTGSREVPAINEDLEEYEDGKRISMFAEGLFALTARYLTVYAIDNLKIACKDAGRCQDATFKYDGRFLTMMTDEPDATITYKFEDFSQYGESIVYDGNPIDLCKLSTTSALTVSAKVSKPGYFDSKTSTYKVEWMGNENEAWTTDGGQLASCYEWNGGGIPISSKHFSVKGSLNVADYEFLNESPFVAHLDLSEVTGGTIPDDAFSSGYLWSLVLPADLKDISGKAFRNCYLPALKWTSTNPIPAGTLDSIVNPNLLLYVADASLAANVADHKHNLVVAGVAENLVLNHEVFYCPEEFIAKEVSYRRNFTMETGIDGECAGWDTIVLPFDVQTVKHESKDDLTPFGVDPEEERLRYWLYAPTTSGWERATSIRANEPYLIAMPNNPAYYEPFNVGGGIIFSAANAVIVETPEDLSRDFTGGTKMVGAYNQVGPTRNFLGINKYGVVDAPDGSLFMSYADIGSPVCFEFEAYIEVDNESLTRAMEIFKSSEVEAVLADMEMRVWTENGGIRIQAGFTARVDVFDMTGRRVAVADVKAGEVCRVDGLAPGIYIAANRKVLLK